MRRRILRCCCRHGVTDLKPIRDRFRSFAGLLASERKAEVEPNLFERLRAAKSIGRSLGDGRFLCRVQRLTGRFVKPGKRGPKPTETDED
jgi:putative transposase